MSTSENTRWRLNRGGIVNIWAYGERTFDLTGGRAIFQGANGSGKSRTLELLLPLCLDGDLRNLGCKGFDSVSMRRLLLDEYSGGASRIGYAWVELHRTSGGTDEFLTCGLGVKASTTSQQITDSWRFITPRRVGHELALAPDGVPLGPAAFREAVGPDRVHPEAAFRERVAELIYGMPPARYGDLLHLQRTLRNPDVGLKVLEGQLEQILSDALPPLDRQTTERIAGSFEDLESIRDRIATLAAADSAFETFGGTYSGYARERLRAADTELRSASQATARCEQERADLATQSAQAGEERSAAESERDSAQAEEDSCDERLSALRELPAYRDVEDSRGRQRIVAAARSAAVSSLEAAGSSRAAEETAAAAVQRAVRRLASDLSAAREAREELREFVASAGLSSDALPELPELSGDEGDAGVTAHVRQSPEPDAEPVEVRRPASRRRDPEALRAAVTRAVDAAESVERAAGERVAVLGSLADRIAKLDASSEELRRAQMSTKDAQVAATEASGLRHQATQELWTAADVWLERVRQWHCQRPDGVGEPELPPVEKLLDDTTVASDVADAARERVEQPLRAARERAGQLDSEREAILREVGSRERELESTRGGQDVTPERPWQVAEDGAPAGSRLYELVEFADHVSEVDRAGIEAALQASGLLTAVVSESGELADRPDVYARQLPAREPSLADVLVPSVLSGSRVSERAVAAVLAGIGFGEHEDADGRSVIAPSGVWHSGSLSGRASKPAAEFVGVGARAEARERRVAALAEELDGLARSRADVEKRLADARSEVERQQEHLDAFPATVELVAARAKVAAQSEAAVRAQERGGAMRKRYDAEYARFSAARSQLEKEAADAGVPSETVPLREARQSAVDARRAAVSLRQALRANVDATLDELRDAAAHAAEAEAARQAAEERAESDCDDYANQLAAHEEAAAAAGAEAEEVRGTVAELERARTRARTERGRAAERVTSARERAAKLEARIESAESGLAEKRNAEEEARRRCLERVTAPGVLAAAFGADVEHPDPADARECLEWVRARLADAGEAPSRETRESAVLSSVQVLQSALAGTHDIVAERQAGMLTVAVADESGTRPVADAARQVAETLAVQRGFLDERYQSIFADYLISDLTEWLREQIEVADDLTRRMNELLDGARSSQGVRVRLNWLPSATLDERSRETLDLLRTPYAERTAEQNARLRAVFTERIESERDSGTGGYGEILARALDYRSWHAFSVKVIDTAPDGKQRQRKLRQLSSGETRLVSYVTLFAAAAAFYDAVGSGIEDATSLPLRLVLLDEAFERLDDPTVARLLGLLVDLDMDWVITWPSGWGVSEKIPKMHIYDILRATTGGGVACVQTTWDGAGVDSTELP